ncbi:hypothetical protein MKX01_009695 [Papaver californicum]|nr:hypothetical protein MKX01_009695 [Papaver californicum]
MLYQLAQGPFTPKRYFSIDRVFRNEAVDRTHLAEFHQIEGVVCDRGLTLGDLVGVLRNFFERLGMKNLRFKPTYNPYTEPSMEIYRPTMILYGIDNIRDLFGPKVDLALIKRNPICRLGINY